MKVQVLGAGTIGSAIARRLCKLHFHVVVTDILPLHDPKIMALPGPAAYMRGPPSDQVFLVPDVEVVVNAGPHTINYKAALAAALGKVAYFDLSEDRESIEYCRDETKANKDWTAMPACGLAPGFVSVLAKHMVDNLKNPYSVQIRVGALPPVPDNALHHRPTWSVEGLVNQYLTPGEVLWHGKIQKMDSLRNTVPDFVAGYDVEAFNTSGGIGTLHETLLGTSVQFVEYRTLRWTGHMRMMKMLIQDLGMTREELIRVLKRVQPSVNDLVLVKVTVTEAMTEIGRRSSGMSLGYWQAYFPRGGESAIQRLTSAGVCGMVELYREGYLPKGFVKQEDIGLEDFLATESGKEFGKVVI